MNLARTAPVNSEFSDADDVNGIVIRSYTPIGEVTGINYGSVSIEAREAIIADTNSTAYFARFEVSTGGDYPQNSATLVRYEDLDDLIVALKKLSSTNITTERFLYSEVEFEISGLSFIVFNNDRGKIMLMIGCNGTSVHFSSISKVSEISQYVVKVKTLLGERRL